MSHDALPTSPEGLRGLSADSDSPPSGSRSPGVSEDWGCSSEIAQADTHADQQLGSLSDEETAGQRGSNDLMSALRSRGGRPVNVAAPFTALPYPLLQLGNDDLQSRTEATLNLLNNLLGVAIMVMPRAFANVGLLNGLVIMVLMALANRYTLLVVLRMANTALDEEPSYPEIGNRVFGRQGLLAVLFSYLLLTGGCLIGMVIGLADTLALLIHVDAPRFLWVLLSVLLCTPGSLLKTLKSVAFLSGVCMLGVVTIVVTLTVVCLGDILLLPQASLTGVGVSLEEEATTTLPPWVPDNSVHWMLSDPRGIFVTTSIFALQFSIQAGGIEVLTRIAPDETESASDGYEPDTIPVAERITKHAFGIAALMCGTCGIAGYMRFGNEVKGNVLLNFNTTDHMLSMTLLRISYVFVITCSFAFIIVPCRFAAYDLFGLRRRNNAGECEEISKKTFRKTTGYILLTCFLASLFVTDLAAMFNYVGVWATSAIAFVLPCIFQIELRRRQEGIAYISSQNSVLLVLVLLGMGILIGNSCEWIGEFFTPALHTVTSEAGSSVSLPASFTTFVPSLAPQLPHYHHATIAANPPIAVNAPIAANPPALQQ